MTANRAFKRRVRARMARTGESYTAALRQLRSPSGDAMTTTPSTTVPTPRVRLAVAQTTPQPSPDDEHAFRAAGDEVLALMRRAHAAGAELLQLPEGTLCFPLRSSIPSSVGDASEADWDRYAWAAQQREIHRIADAARELRLWTVLGAPQRAPGGGRPWLSLLVVDRTGQVAARYDERLLSRTKAAYLYRAGEREVTFDVDGVRFGLASGLEAIFEDVFSDYETAGVYAVLYSTAGPGQGDAADSLVTSARVHARHNGIAVGYAVHADKAPVEPAGVIGPDGGWRGRCHASPEPDIVLAEVGAREPSAAHDWRRAMVEAHRAGRDRR